MAYVAEIVSRYLLVIPLLASHFTDSLVGPVLYCRLSRALHDVAVFVSFFDVIVLAIERTIATIASHTYEAHRSIAVGVILVLVQVCMHRRIVGDERSILVDGGNHVRLA